MFFLPTDANRLLAQIQAAFIFFLYVQNFASLLAFKRLLSLCTRCQEIFIRVGSQDKLLNHHRPSTSSIIEFYLKLVTTLDAQLQVVPETFFTIDLAGTGLEDFWYTEVEQLIRNYGLNACATDADLDQAIAGLRNTAKRRFGWILPELGQLRVQKAGEEMLGEDLEEGEDAPVVVEL